MPLVSATLTCLVVFSEIEGAIAKESRVSYAVRSGDSERAEITEPARLAGHALDQGARMLRRSGGKESSQLRNCTHCSFLSA